ncbi:RNA polymerase sigma factor RpoE [Magnetococcales bacterium HHB-1]
MSHPDQFLVDKAKKGDKKAFELLVRKYQGRIAAVISRTISDMSRVQDLTQEAFLKAYRALPKFRGDSAFYTWLYRIAVNTAKNAIISSERSLPMADVEIEQADRLASQLRDYDTPERIILKEELFDTLKAAIEQLPETMKTAVTLRDINGLTYEEIAQDMNCPIGTVRSRIFRGRQEIADRLQGYRKLKSNADLN